MSRSFTDFVVLCAFLFPFYADELTTTYVRLRDGENLLRPHRRHIYQILANEKGIAHWKVSVGYGFLQLAVGLSVLWIISFGFVAVLSLLAFYFIAFALWVTRCETAQRKTPNPHFHPALPISAQGRFG